jgi:nucleoside-diphosphate-sugar epimerase
MTGAEAGGWEALPFETGSDELHRWVPGIRQPIAVTGATGFVGSHLVEALVRGGVRPRLLVRDPARLLPGLAERCEVLRGDVEDAVAVHRLAEGCGTLLHLAGRLRAARAADFDRTNRGGTENVVAATAAAAPGARLIYVSSLAAAGPSDDPAGRSPDEPPAPISAYGRSKLAGEAAVRGGAAPWSILRPPAIYGPRDVDVLQFFKLAAGGIVPLPAGERTVTVAHVADVVRAILAAAAGAATGAVTHLGEPEPLEMRALIVVLAEAGGVRARTVSLPAALVRVAGAVGDALQRLGFAGVALTRDKAGELLARHWSARTASSLAQLGLPGYVPFAAGAAATWEWYRRAGWLPHAKIRRV